MIANRLPFFIAANQVEIKKPPHLVLLNARPFGSNLREVMLCHGRLIMTAMFLQWSAWIMAGRF